MKKNVSEIDHFFYILINKFKIKKRIIIKKSQIMSSNENMDENMDEEKFEDIEATVKRSFSNSH